MSTKKISNVPDRFVPLCSEIPNKFSSAFENKCDGDKKREGPEAVSGSLTSMADSTEALEGLSYRDVQARLKELGQPAKG